MDNSFMVGLSAQKVLRQRMDMTANNLANMTTTGFKAEHLVTREISEKPISVQEKPHDVSFVDGWMLQRDFSTGAMERTGNPLDVAIEGEGFFVVQMPDGSEAYTRDGAFSLNDGGDLVTKSGLVVQGATGPIEIDPQYGAAQISRDGTINQGLEKAGQLKIVAFDTPAGMKKIGDNLWQATDETPRDAKDLRVAGGFLEQSNVNPVLELTQMIQISQTYQSVTQLISQTDELRATSIDKLSRVG